MAKYEPLSKLLGKQTKSEVAMTFSEIEHVLGAKLPPSAYRHRPWWANDAANHVHAKAWLDAGYETAAVDMQRKKLVFKRVRATASRPGLSEPQRSFKPEPEPERPAGRHPAIGAMKGWLVMDPDLDLTKPAMPEWADMIDEKYGPERSK